MTHAELNNDQLQLWPVMLPSITTTARRVNIFLHPLSISPWGWYSCQFLH